MKIQLCGCSHWFLAAVCLLAALIAQPPLLSAAERVVARVSDAVITEADLQDAIEKYVPRGVYHAGVDTQGKEKYRGDALNDLIERELFWKEAQREGIKASDEAVDAIMQQNIKQFGSVEKMNEVITARGFTPDGFRERVRKNIAVNTLLRELGDRSKYSDDELRTYYEKNRSRYRKPDALRLQHILISVDPTATDEVWQEKRKFAEQLLERIRAGEDFGTIAYQYSDDTYKYKSGDLGFVHRGRLTPQELEDSAFALKKDEVSSVIRTIHGYHIIKAGEQKPGETKSFDEVKDRLKNELEKERFEERKKSLLEKLRKEHRVEIISEAQDSGTDK